MSQLAEVVAGATVMLSDGMIQLQDDTQQLELPWLWMKISGNPFTYEQVAELRDELDGWLIVRNRRDRMEAEILKEVVPPGASRTNDGSDVAEMAKPNQEGPRGH